MKKSCVLPVFLALLMTTRSGAAPRPAAMTNQDVIDMVAAGLSEDVIVVSIGQAVARDFDLAAGGLIALKRGKVSDAIIRTMQAADGEAPGRIAQPSIPASQPAARAVSPVRSLSDASATTVEEPATFGAVFRISPATGALTALEQVEVKDTKLGKVQSRGGFHPDEQNYIRTIDGVSSSVSFKHGERQLFAVRLMTPGGGSGRQATPEEVRRHFVVTRLEVEGGHRYATTVDAPFEVRSYGQPVPGLDGKKPDRVAVSFQLFPLMPLPPGQYVVSMSGMRKNFELLDMGKAVMSILTRWVGSAHWAFGVVDR